MVVREHIPLEQGLRRNRLQVRAFGRKIVREHIPLEQGLRLLRHDCVNLGLPVREHIPLEQGLRQSLKYTNGSSLPSESIFH